MKNMVLTAIVRKEGRRYSSLCPELDIASCGDSIQDAISELRKAIKLYFKVTKKRLIHKTTEPIYVTQLKLAS